MALKYSTNEISQNHIDSLLTQIPNSVYDINTGNPFIDVLVSEKISLAQNQNIKCDICINLKDISFIKNMDFCSLFGNLLDNCIEATSGFTLPQYALCGYKVKAFDFLIKPFSYSQLKKVLTSSLSELSIKSEEFLIVKNSSSIYKLNFSEIMYLETYNRNILFHLNHGAKIIGHKKMKEYEKLLDNQFYRCHSSYIVNMHYITSIQKGSVTINKKIDIPISRYKKKNFENSYTIFLCNLL